MASAPTEDDEVAKIAAQLRQIEVVPISIRRAFKTLAPLIEALPATDTMLFSAESVGAFQVLRSEDPEIFMTYRAAVRTRCGRHIVDLLDERLAQGPASSSRELRLLSAADLLAQPAPAWIAKDLLPQRGLAIPYGESQSGKTFLSLDLSLSIARGEPWFGIPIVQGGVIYIAAEGRLRDRVAAYKRHHNLDNDALRNFLIIEETIDLTSNNRDLDRICELTQEAAQKLGQVSMIVIDTVARVMSGSDENSGKDMGAFIGAARRIEDACQGLVLAIHHSGKDSSKGARGHSSLRAASDVEIEVTRDDSGLRMARVTKLRDGADGATFSFRLASVAIGVDESSCVVEPSDESQAVKTRSRKLPAGAQVGLDALKAALETNGQTLPGTSSIPPNVRAVRVEAWQTAFAHSRPIAKELSEDEVKRERNARRMAFQRAQDQLQAARAVGTSGGYWWIK